MAIKKRGRPPKAKATEIIIKKRGRPLRNTEIFEKRRTLKFTDLRPENEATKQEDTHNDDDSKKTNHWYPKSKTLKEKAPKDLKELLGERMVTNYEEKIWEDKNDGATPTITQGESRKVVSELPKQYKGNLSDVVIGDGVNHPYMGSISSIKKATDIKKDAGTPLFTKDNAPRSPGRPVGSRNKTTLALEIIGEENAPAVYAKAVEMALNGDSTCIRLILDRIHPIRRGTNINLSFDGPLDTIQDINEASKYVTRMAFDGEISFEEAEECGKLLERRMKIITDAVAVVRIENTIRQVELIKGCV